MGSFKSVGLLDSVTGTYDPTKTTIFGRTQQTTINGIDCLGGPLSRFIDTFADTGYAALGPIWLSSNNRLYVALTAVSTGAQIAVYDFNVTTGVAVYRGKICVLLPNTPATVHTIRGVRVYNDVTDNSGAWRVFICTSSATTGIINSGMFCVNGVDVRDFIPGNIGALPSAGNIIPIATGTDQKAVYFIQNPNAIGASYLVNAPAAMLYEPSTNYIWMHQGLAAATHWTAFNAAVASFVLPTRSVTLSAAAPCIVGDVGHPFKENDMVVFSAGTMPFTTLLIGTTYFVRNVGANQYELAATVGGASISTATGTPSTATISRAHGQTGSGFVSHTSQMPALTGTLLVTDSADNAIPTNSPINGAVLNGQSCAAFATNSNLYLGKLSELATSNAMLAGAISVAVPGVITHLSHPFSGNEPVIILAAVGVTAAGTAHTYAPPTGLLTNTVYYIKYVDANSYQLSAAPGGASIATTANPCYASYICRVSDISWPSLATSNLLGTLNQLTAPAALHAGWDNTTDGFIFTTNVSKFVSKQLINNSIRALFGSIDNTYYEGLIDPRIVFGMAALGGITRKNGWLLASGTTIGQRGIQTLDVRSDEFYEYSYIITPVIDSPGSILRLINTTEQLYDFSGVSTFYYRTSDFSTPTSGTWIGPVSRQELASAPISNQIQLKILFAVQSLGYDMPPQLSDVVIGTDAVYEISPNWEYSHNNSSTSSPTRVSFRLKAAYTSTVPELHFRAYDLFDSLLTHFNTTAHPSYFEYSTDDGVNWLPLGTIANAVGTLVRFTFVSPPGVDVRPSLNEI